jgi:hypothetical protein
MSVDENLMCSFQILRPSTQKTLQEPKGTTSHKSSAPTKTSNIKK